MAKQKTYYEWRYEEYEDGDGSVSNLDFGDKLADLRIKTTEGYGWPHGDGHKVPKVNEGWTISLSKRLYLWEFEQWMWEDEDLFMLELDLGKFCLNDLGQKIPKRFYKQVEELNETLD